jgi:hypothetical protein
VNDFDGITAEMTSSDDWYAAVQEARARLDRERPGGAHTSDIGHEAWRQLTPVQQALALDGLFHAYIMRLHEEERAAQRDREMSDEPTTYLEPFDETLLTDAVVSVEPLGPETQVTVYASALQNVLLEVDLLRHRLAMARRAARKTQDRGNP